MVAQEGAVVVRLGREESRRDRKAATADEERQRLDCSQYSTTGPVSGAGYAGCGADVTSILIGSALPNSFAPSVMWSQP